MKEKKTIADVLAFAVEQFKAANIRNAKIEAGPIISSYATMNVRRSFGIEGTITVRASTFRPTETATGECELNMVPTVEVSFVGSQRDVVRATAFMHLVNELTLLAASLQAQIDEFEVVEVISTAKQANAST